MSAGENDRSWYKVSSLNIPHYGETFCKLEEKYREKSRMVKDGPWTGKSIGCESAPLLIRGVLAVRSSAEHSLFMHRQYQMRIGAILVNRVCSRVIDHPHEIFEESLACPEILFEVFIFVSNPETSLWIPLFI